jgi:hypothetical protein
MLCWICIRVFVAGGKSILFYTRRGSVAWRRVDAIYCIKVLE